MTTTSERIVSAAAKLFYAEGIGRVSMDRVAEMAEVTKKTLYYHFRSKDDLVAAYLVGRDQPNLELFKRWFEEADGGPAEKIRAVFVHLARSARHPKWKGCGFLRTAAELTAMPGHPAMKAAAAHKKGFEAWMRSVFQAAGIVDDLQLARQILLLLDGSFSVVLLHRDPSYMEIAGETAFGLVKAVLRPVPARRVSPLLRESRRAVQGSLRAGEGRPAPSKPS